MTLHQKIKNEIREAMLAKEAVRLTVVRGLASAFVNELVAKKRKPTEELKDDEALVVIKRAVKQHRDSIEQFTAGDRKDLVKEEEAELKILETYLPKMLDEKEIRKIATAVKAKLKVSDKSKAGIFVGVVMKECKGLADGASVKKIAEELLA
ncbi:MAG TPA: GatB/YqeY domain-containing protein [Candidatus Paceibacterota bacterium]